MGDTKYLMRSVKIEVEGVGIWTEEKWDMKRINLSYTIVSRRFIFNINKKFD